jgi:hypothetical protein
MPADGRAGAKRGAVAFPVPSQLKSAFHLLSNGDWIRPEDWDSRAIPEKPEHYPQYNRPGSANALPGFCGGMR